MNRSWIYEMKNSLDENDNLQKTVIIDLANMVLNKSEVANKIYKRSKNLYKAISRTLKIDKVIVNRIKSNNIKKNDVLRKRKKYNHLNSPDNQNPVWHVLEFNTDGGKINQLTFYTNNGHSSIVEKENSIHRSFIKQFKAGLDKSQNIVSFVDYSLSVPGEYLYTMEVFVEDAFLLHVTDVLRDLQQFHGNLQNYYNEITSGKEFNYDSNKISRNFVKKVFSDYGVVLSDNLMPIDFENSKKGLKNSFFVKGIDHIIDASKLLGFNIDINNFLNKIHPIHATPTTISMAIADVEKISRKIISYYKIPVKKNSSYTAGASLGTKSSKNFLVIKNKTKLEPYVKKESAPIKYKFIKLKSNSKLPIISKEMFTRRANQEVSKFFKGSISDSSKLLKDLPKPIRSELSNIEKDKYLHFTPESIKVGEVEFDTSQFDIDKTKPELFQTIQISRKSKELSSDPQLVSKLLIDSLTQDEVVEPLNASEFFGDNSPLTKDIFRTIKKQPLLLMKNKKTLDTISFHLFAKKDRQKRLSLKDFDPKNRDNKLLLSLKKGAVKPKNVPIQIRSLLISESSQVKNNFIKDKVDIFSDPKTNEIAHQNFTNIRKVQYLDRFHTNKDGTFDLSRPIFKDLDGTGFEKIKSTTKLCILTKPSENGIESELEDDFDSTDDTFILEDEYDNEQESEFMGPYFILGTSEMGSSEGMNGYFYPIYLSEEEAQTVDETGLQSMAHPHTFVEYPGITFYMPNHNQNHAKENPPENLTPYIRATEQRSDNSDIVLNNIEMSMSSFTLLLSTTNPIMQNKDYPGIAKEIQIEPVMAQTNIQQQSVTSAFSSAPVTSPTANITGGGGSGY